MARSGKCVRKRIVIKGKRGKVVAAFMGRQGAGCGPRKKPSTRHLAPWKKTLAVASKQCARRGGGVKTFRRCVGQAVHSVRG